MILALSLVSASAHIAMDSPTPVTTALKTGPCGDGSHVRGDAVAVFEPGATITVQWHETINHPSTYRISFDDDGDDSFADPAAYDDYYVNSTVLLDAIPDEADGTLSVEVTLPAVTCERCTLQLVQLMLDKPPYAPGTNDLYYQCADLALRVESGTGTTDAQVPHTGTGPTGTRADETGGLASDVDDGCGCVGSSGRAQLVWGPIVVVVSFRRRPLRPGAVRRRPAPVHRDAHFGLTGAALVLPTVAQRYRLDLVPGHPVEVEPLLTLRPRHGLMAVPVAHLRPQVTRPPGTCTS